MYTVPQNPLSLISYAFQALGKTQLSIQQLVFFISFDLRKLPPSKVKKIIQDLHAKGELEVSGEIVLQPKLIEFEINSSHQTSSDLGGQLRLFVSSSRLSRAVGIDDQAIDFRRVSEVPLKIKATVHGSRKYILELDEEQRQISHDCPDWQRVSVLHRFCKHVAKLFLLLEKEEALRLLQSLQKNPWEFIQL
jgi:hypothetical protein